MDSEKQHKERETKTAKLNRLFDQYETDQGEFEREKKKAAKVQRTPKPPPGRRNRRPSLADRFTGYEVDRCGLSTDSCTHIREMQGTAQPARALHMLFNPNILQTQR